MLTKYCTHLARPLASLSFLLAACSDDPMQFTSEDGRVLGVLETSSPVAAGDEIVVETEDCGGLVLSLGMPRDLWRDEPDARADYSNVTRTDLRGQGLDRARLALPLETQPGLYELSLTCYEALSATTAFEVRGRSDAPVEVTDANRPNIFCSSESIKPDCEIVDLEDRNFADDALESSE